MQNADDILFSGGMNTDDDPRMFEKGDYLLAQNIRVGSAQEQGDNGLVQSIKSTLKTEINDSIPNLGTVEYYASVVDEETKIAYVLAIAKHPNDIAYFIIIKHDLTTNLVSLIFRQPASTWGMKLWDDDMQKIYNPVIVDHNLIWTDNVNDVRMINVNRAEISYTNGITISRPFDSTFCASPGYENGELVSYNGLNYKAKQQTLGEVLLPDNPSGSFDPYSTDSVITWDSVYANSPGYDIGTLVYFRDSVYRVVQDTVGTSIEVTDAAYYTYLCKIIDCYFSLRNPNNFTLAALPPLISPTVEYATDESIVINQLRGKIFQFSYRYVYLDWRRSTYAPPSTVPPPNKEETTAGVANTNPSLNNRLDITINTGTDDVRFIEVIARDSSDLATWYKIAKIIVINNIDWKINVPNTDITIQFYNNVVKTVIDSELVYTPFSYVPIKAKHMEVLDNNILSFGNITEGYGSVDDKVDIDLSWNDLSFITTQSYPFDVLYHGFDGILPTWEDYELVVMLPYVGLGYPGTYKLQLTIPGIPIANPGSTQIIEYAYNGTDPYPSTVIAGLQAAVVVVYGSGALTTCHYTNYIANRFCLFFGSILKPGHGPYYSSSTRKGWFEVSVVADVDKYPALSTGFLHSWGIVYRDIAGRLSPVIGADTMSKYIPFITESASTTEGSIPEISFSINHTPPEWADSYEIMYSGNRSADWFLFLIGYNYTKGKKEHSDEYDLGTHSDNNQYRIRLTAAQSNTRTFFSNWSVEEYVWQKGDRIRIIGTIIQSGVLTKINSGVWDTEITGSYVDKDFPNLISYTASYTRTNDVITVDTGAIPHLYTTGQIIQLDFTSGTATDGEYTVGVVITDYIFNVVSVGNNTSGNVTIYPGEASDDTWLYFKQSSILTLIPTSPYTDGLYFQIYRPKLILDTTLFYTTGMTFNISIDNYGNKFHEGNVNQVLNSSGDSITPASIINLSHDAWKYIRNFRSESNAVTIYLFAESQFVSDWYISQQLTSSGFPIADIDSQKQNILTKRIRHGGSLNIGTQINNIAKFDYDDYKDLKDEDGPIEGMRIVGFTLKVLQRTKVTSIFIGRSESYNANGSPDYQFTNKVFGSVRPNEENWGTSHPDSIVVNGRNIYYWDQSEGVVVRDAPNGSFAISNYKMKRYFADKAKLFDTEDKKDQGVYFAISTETDEVFCVFGATSAKQALTFNEKDTRWKSIIDIQFVNGSFYWIGKRLFHISENVIYEWWMGADYQNINGTESEGRLEFYSTGSPIKPKIFNSIIAYQNGGEPEFESVIVPEKATSGEGEMETRIFPANIDKREGIYYCQVLRDINDPKPATQNAKLSNGRVLRGLYAKITMLFTGSTKKTLSNVSVLTTPSERSR